MADKATGPAGAGSKGGGAVPGGMPMPGMKPVPNPQPKQRPSGMTLMRRRILAGLIVALPIWITVTLIMIVFRFLRDASLWALEGMLATEWGRGVVEGWGVTAESYAEQGVDALPAVVRWGLGGLAVLVTISVLYIVGGIASNVAGKRALGLMEYFVDRLPFVKTIYRASKQVLETFAGDATVGLQRVVTVPFPNEKARSIGFVTAVFTDPGSGVEYCTVFIPTTPNPTTGFLFLYPRVQLVEVDMKVEEAIKTIISAGALMPGEFQVTKAKLG